MMGRPLERNAFSAARHAKFRADVGVVFKEERQSRGLSMRLLEYQSGLMGATISNIERGSAGLTLENVLCLSEALGISDTVLPEIVDLWRASETVEASHEQK
ncbi:helix-turn-helix domain-containing protein [Acetobacter sicerae]|uniref:Helix-turn-helix domain-containing protein n=1 Tax=Acetobacter sicerae TaxID=85325 RepID=A0ABS8W1M5_9PROT|nr:helix-turn-helix transcriptional regulator [Acetobacter sicerae]MCE0745565.1 helix-turn-helix domain-containing protein [Acetobacter sicerae]